MVSIEDFFPDLIEKWRRDGKSIQSLLEEVDINERTAWQDWLPAFDQQRVADAEPFDPMHIGLRVAKRNAGMKRAIRLIQRYTTEFDDTLDAWLRNWNYSDCGGPGATDELNISIGDLSDKNRARIEDLLRRWIQPSNSVAEIQDYLRQAKFQSA